MLYEMKIVKYFQFGTFLFFMTKKSWKSKIDIDVQFLILNRNWMEEWSTDPQAMGSNPVDHIFISWIFRSSHYHHHFIVNLNKSAYVIPKNKLTFI